MSKILITGGAGFIGSHLAQACLDAGQPVRVLDNLSTGSRDNLRGLDVELIEGDIRDAGVVQRAIQGVETVFHQAAMVSVPQSMKEPDACYQVNVIGTLNLLEAARKAGVGRVVLASTCAIYGDADNLPLTETEPPRPLSPYAASKLADEGLAQLYTIAYNLPVTALRYFNVFGPRQSPFSAYAAAIPIFIHRALQGQSPVIFGDGLQQRDFVFVGDVVRANLLAAANPGAAGQVFNVCSGKAVTVLDLLSTLGKLLPSMPEARFDAPRHGDIYRSLGDGRKARERLGFTAQVSLEHGLQSILESMRA